MATTPNSIITPQTPNAGVAGVLLTTAMTNTKAFDGTDTPGTALALVYTVGANGGKIDNVFVRFASASGSTATGTTAATVVRLWANNGSANTTATNNIFLGEALVPATAVTALATSANSVAAQFTGIPTLPAGYKLYVGSTVAIGGTLALAVSAFGGDF